MNSQTRMLTAFAFREPDRVPIELGIDPRAYQLPAAERLVRFIETEADNFQGVGGGIDWGFFGLPERYREEIIEDRPGEYRRIRRTRETAAGSFHAITKHYYPHLDSPDYHWERRFIHTLEDMHRLADAPRASLRFSRKKYDEEIRRIGVRGVPLLGLLHPLGLLVRQANMEEVYCWLLSEKDLLRRFLEKTNAQIVNLMGEIGAQGVAPWFGIVAHEMLIPPWMGLRQFNEWVFPYDQAVNAAIHRNGGRLRSHCHGNCLRFLERMSAMGIDAIEPLEPPPFGDVDLKAAKRNVGARMVLSGNIPSQQFCRLSPEDVRRLVQAAVAAAAPGGGFTLRTTGGNANVDADLDGEMLARIIQNVEAYIEAGLEFGQYPIHQ